MMRHLKYILSGLLFAVIGTLAAAQSEYRIQPGDSLQIEVLEDSSLNRAVVVLPDGRFNFPFAGSVQASGRTATQIQSAVAQGIGPNFATTPTVFVSVRPGVASLETGQLSAGEAIEVFFLGEVNSPGVILVKRGTNLLQAMAIGGGVTRFAAVKRIQVRRTNPQTGVQNVITLNYQALANGTASNSIELRDGDVILVPERRLFE